MFYSVQISTNEQIILKFVFLSHFLLLQQIPFLHVVREITRLKTYDFRIKAGTCAKGLLSAGIRFEIDVFPTVYYPVIILFHSVTYKPYTHA